jgi:hypothetical protein
MKDPSRCNYNIKNTHFNVGVLITDHDGPVFQILNIMYFVLLSYKNTPSYNPIKIREAYSDSFCLHFYFLL